MKIKFVDTKKIKKIAGCVLIGAMLAAPLAGLAEDYTIQKGDTLTGISNKFYGTTEYADELALINKIADPNFIRAGDVIYIPEEKNLDFCGQDNYYYGEPDVLYYEFQEGDTLWQLAVDNYGSGTFWKSLAAYNGITNPRKIANGRIIKIPAAYKLDLSLNGSNYGESEDEVKVRTHTFEEGDTLWALAKEYYGNGNYWEALAIYNNISNPKKISNGTVVVLPHKDVLKGIQEGNYAMDLYTISKKVYGTSRYASLIASLNGLINRGNYMIKDLYLPSENDIKVYYESDTYEYTNDGYYVVKIGDTFKSIAELVYEDASFADYLKEVNGLDKLEPGIMIYIPEVVRVNTK